MEMCAVFSTAAALFRQVLVAGAHRNCDIPQLKACVTHGIFQVLKKMWPYIRVGTATGLNDDSCCYSRHRNL